MELSVLIAEPHDILRTGLHAILENDGRVVMIFEASNAEELRKHLSNNLLDLVIINQILVSDIMTLPASRFVLLTSEFTSLLF